MFNNGDICYTANEINMIKKTKILSTIENEIYHVPIRVLTRHLVTSEQPQRYTHRSGRAPNICILKNNEKTESYGVVEIWKSVYAKETRFSTISSGNQSLGT